MVSVTLEGRRSVGRIRVALDAMGGDDSPRVPVEAAISVVSQHDIDIVLVGDQNAIEATIGDRSYPGTRLEVVDAPEQVTMEDAAVIAVRRKRKASIPVGLQLVREANADVFLSAGNTGAVVASATLGLGRMTGISRPGIAIPLPTLAGTPVVLIDAGALIDPAPRHLWQHARLASVYATITADVEQPSVGLISNGEEDSKGNALTRATYELLSNDPSVNFIGNVEPRAIPSRPCDVLVTDGFTGNIILKTAEGIVNLMQGTLRREFKSRLYTGVLATLLKPAMRRAGRTLDYREYGGAPLLGVNGLVFIAHGGSDMDALENAILSASSAARHNLLRSLQDVAGTDADSHVQASDRKIRG